jgi:hypothetical protein
VELVATADGSVRQTIPGSPLTTVTALTWLSADALLILEADTGTGIEARPLLFSAIDGSVAEVSMGADLPADYTVTVRQGTLFMTGTDDRLIIASIEGANHDAARGRTRSRNASGASRPRPRPSRAGHRRRRIVMSIEGANPRRSVAAKPSRSRVRVAALSAGRSDGASVGFVRPRHRTDEGVRGRHILNRCGAERGPATGPGVPNPPGPEGRGLERLPAGRVRAWAERIGLDRGAGPVWGCRNVRRRHAALGAGSPDRRLRHGEAGRALPCPAECLEGNHSRSSMPGG